MTLRKLIRSFVIILAISFLVYFLLLHSADYDPYGYLILIAGMIFMPGTIVDFLLDVLLNGDIYGGSNTIIVCMISAIFWWLFYYLILAALRDIKNKWVRK